MAPDDQAKPEVDLPNRRIAINQLREGSVIEMEMNDGHTIRFKVYKPGEGEEDNLLEPLYGVVEESNIEEVPIDTKISLRFSSPFAVGRRCFLAWPRGNVIMKTGIMPIRLDAESISDTDDLSDNIERILPILEGIADKLEISPITASIKSVFYRIMGRDHEGQFALRKDFEFEDSPSEWRSEIGERLNVALMKLISAQSNVVYIDMAEEEFKEIFEGIRQFMKIERADDMFCSLREINKIIHIRNIEFELVLQVKGQTVVNLRFKRNKKPTPPLMMMVQPGPNNEFTN